MSKVYVIGSYERGLINEALIDYQQSIAAWALDNDFEEDNYAVCIILNPRSEHPDTVQMTPLEAMEIVYKSVDALIRIDTKGVGHIEPIH